jgi:ABC-type lipoprotein export system ATPase subunit
MTLTVPAPARGTATEAAVHCESVVQIYRVDDLEVVALRGVDLTVGTGQTVALLGASGSGKSTLLSLLAGLLRPSAGQVLVAGRNVGKLTERELLALRRTEVGVLLQNAARNLLPYASALENLTFAQRGTGRRRRDRRLRAGELLDAVGLAGAAATPVHGLSGGEQQRLGLAVSLANGPRILLADEPTSQLDAASGGQVVALLRDARDRWGTTVLVVTHDPAVSAAMDRTVTMRDGRVGAEGHRGEDLAVVGRDGSVQLPAEALEVLPPGSLARVVRREHGVELRRVDDVAGAGPDATGPDTTGPDATGPGLIDGKGPDR